MREFVVMADSDSEIPYTFADEYQVPVFLMPYTLDGKEELFDLGRTTDYVGFYEQLAAGGEASTATRPPADIQAFFEEIIKDNKDILYISFSSQLSAHYELSLVAREAALENYPDARIEIFDALGIAMGSGLLVYHAVMLKEQGKSLDEILAWLNENRQRSLHFFSVDSLAHLRKTGRLSAVNATLGSILDLKPILTVTKEGKIVAFDKVKGRKRVVKALADLAEENYVDDDICKELCVVCHGNNPGQALLLKNELERRLDFKEVWFLDVGPVIGSHCGPGVMALLMMGKERTV
ncbi:MAG: DegV family protein [Christensenellaceae bacterium]|jgi:DegV family protein with EDD domain